MAERNEARKQKTDYETGDNAEFSRRKNKATTPHTRIRRPIRRPTLGTRCFVVVSELNGP